MTSTDLSYIRRSGIAAWTSVVSTLVSLERARVPPRYCPPLHQSRPVSRYINVTHTECVRSSVRILAALVEHCCGHQGRNESTGKHCTTAQMSCYHLYHVRNHGATSSRCMLNTTCVRKSSTKISERISCPHTHSRQREFCSTAASTVH